MAIGVGAQRDPGHIDKSHWVKLAKDAGLGAPFVVRRVEEMVSAAPRAADLIANRLADASVDTAPFDRLTTIIADLCRRAAQLLGAKAKNASKR